MSTGRTEKEQVRVHIRWMIRRDMPEVLQTEQESFEFAWTEEDFLRCLRQRNCIGMVAEQGEKVVGFMIYELHKAKLHILNFAVHPACRRAGVGAQMVAKLISKLSSHRRTRITLEVRETNLAAQLFFRNAGLPGRARAAGLLRGQRRGRLPDAVPPRRRHGRGCRGEPSTASRSTKRTEQSRKPLAAWRRVPSRKRRSRARRFCLACAHLLP